MRILLVRLALSIIRKLYKKNKRPATLARYGITDVTPINNPSDNVGGFLQIIIKK